MPERARTDAARRGAVVSPEARAASDVIGTAEEAHVNANVSAQQRPGRSFLRSRWDILLVISLGGALGSLARWGVGELLPWSGEDFPWATFIENVSGGFLLGVLMVFLLDVLPPRRYLRPFLGVGLLGGYTTFSTYMLEARELLYSDHVVTAVAYLGGSLLAGLVAVWLGIGTARLVDRLAQRRRRRHRDEDALAPQPTDRRSRP